MLLLFCIAGYAGTDSRLLRETSVPASRLSGRAITWFGTEPLKTLTASVDDNWQQSISPLAYSQLLCSLHAQQDFIPMRYGSLLADDNALKRWLKENTHALLSQLEHLRGGVEMTVLIPDKGIAATGELKTKETIKTGKGAAYLQACRNKYVHTRHNEALSLLKEAMDKVYRNCRAEPVCHMDQPLVSVHFLVPRTLVKTFQQRLAPLLEHHPDWISCAPCPPFSFVNGKTLP